MHPFESLSAYVKHAFTGENDRITPDSPLISDAPEVFDVHETIETLKRLEAEHARWFSEFPKMKGRFLFDAYIDGKKVEIEGDFTQIATIRLEPDGDVGFDKGSSGGIVKMMPGNIPFAIVHGGNSETGRATATPLLPVLEQIVEIEEARAQGIETYVTPRTQKCTDGSHEWHYAQFQDGELVTASPTPAEALPKGQLRESP